MCYFRHRFASLPTGEGIYFHALFRALPCAKGAPPKAVKDCRPFSHAPQRISFALANFIHSVDFIAAGNFIAHPVRLSPSRASAHFIATRFHPLCGFHLPKADFIAHPVRPPLPESRRRIKLKNKSPTEQNTLSGFYFYFAFFSSASHRPLI